MKFLSLRYQSGLSLIELMVAMLISLLLLGGVLQVFLSSKELYRTNTAVARVQESGRFAIEFLAFDIRQAGYKGECLSEPLNHLALSTLSADLQNAYSTTPAIRGWDNSKPTFFTSGEAIRANTDSLIVKYAGDGREFEANGPNNALNQSLATASSTSAYAGQIIFLSNSTGCDVFRNSDNANAFEKAGGNAVPNQNWSQSYGGRFSAHILRSHTYYIRNNAKGLPSLVRRVLSPGTTTEELVEGVIDMQVTYGLDQDGDRLADIYVKAGTNNLPASGLGNWDKVVSARISMLVISPEKNALEQQQKFVYPAAAGVSKEDDFAIYDNGTVTLKDNRVGQVFTTTVAIRNRLP